MSGLLAAGGVPGIFGAVAPPLNLRGGNIKINQLVHPGDATRQPLRVRSTGDKIGIQRDY
jgi:hypothetical protein